MHTLFDPEALGLHVAEAFGLAPVEDCRLWRSFLNDVYRLKASGQYWWIRVQPVGWRSRSETDSELRAILSIANAGGSVAAPLPLPTGGYVLPIKAPEGLRDAVVFTNAPGSDLRYFGEDGIANARRYGEAVAHFHNASETVTQVVGRARLDWTATVLEPAATISRFLDPADQADLSGIVGKLHSGLKKRDDLSWGFCHGDFNSMNIHFAGNQATVFDFDCCAWGWHAFELAGFARGVSWSRQPGDEVKGLIQSFLLGYSAHRPIAAADQEVQPLMLLAQRLWVTSLHLDRSPRWGAAMFGRPYAAKFMDWLRNWEPAG